MTAFFQSLGLSYEWAWTVATLAGILIISLLVMFSVAMPCAVAQVPGGRSACARSQSALRRGYQVQHATAPTVSSAPRA